MGGDTFTLGMYIGSIIKIALGAASVVAVMFLTYAGIMYMVAGNSGGGAALAKAKEKIINGGIGILILAASWIILNTINPELLNINPKIGGVVFGTESGDSGGRSVVLTMALWRDSQ